MINDGNGGTIPVSIPRINGRSTSSVNGITYTVTRAQNGSFIITSSSGTSIPVTYSAAGTILTPVYNASGTLMDNIEIANGIGGSNTWVMAPPVGSAISAGQVIGISVDIFQYGSDITYLGNNQISDGTNTITLPITSGMVHSATYNNSSGNILVYTTNGSGGINSTPITIQAAAGNSVTANGITYTVTQGTAPNTFTVTSNNPNPNHFADIPASYSTTVNVPPAQGTIAGTSYSGSNPNIITSLSVNDGNGGVINLSIPDGNNILDQGTVSTADGYTISTNDKGVLTVSKSGAATITVNPPAGLVLSTTSIAPDGITVTTITDGKGNIVTLTSNGTNPYTTTTGSIKLGTDSGGHDYVSNGTAGQIVVQDPYDASKSITVTLPPQPAAIVPATPEQGQSLYYGPIPGNPNLLLEKLPDGTLLVTNQDNNISFPVTLDATNHTLTTKSFGAWIPTVSGSYFSTQIYQGADFTTKYRLVSVNNNIYLDGNVNSSIATLSDTSPDGKTKSGYKYLSASNGGGVITVDGTFVSNVASGTNALTNKRLLSSAWNGINSIDIGSVLMQGMDGFNQQEKINISLHIVVSTDNNCNLKYGVCSSDWVLFEASYNATTGQGQIICGPMGRYTYTLTDSQKAMVNIYDTTKPVTAQTVYSMNVAWNSNTCNITKCNIPLADGTTKTQYLLSNSYNSYDIINSDLSTSKADVGGGSNYTIYTNTSADMNLGDPKYEIPQELLDAIRTAH